MVASPNGDAEKDAPDNLSLAGDGFDAVARVSCADIIAIAARDVVAIVRNPSTT
ncbi:Peroxidase 55 [Linum perenne]